MQYARYCAVVPCTVQSTTCGTVARMIIHLVILSMEGKEDSKFASKGTEVVANGDMKLLVS
jgi:hypothetical protein